MFVHVCHTHKGLRFQRRSCTRVLLHQWAKVHHRIESGHFLSFLQAGKGDLARQWGPDASSGPRCGARSATLAAVRRLGGL